MKNYNNQGDIRHLCNGSYNVLLGMNRNKAEKIYKDLVNSGYKPTDALKIIEDVFKIKLHHEEDEKNGNA